MLKIYGSYRSRATRLIWLLDELGVPFEIEPVLQARRVANAEAADAPVNTTSGAFLEVNPNGRVPVLDDDGFVMFESLAISLYLAKKHGGPLAPETLREDGLMTMWTVWAVAELEPVAVQIMYHTALLPPEDRKPEVAEASADAVGKPFGVLEKALAGKDYLVGDRFTVADINVAECARYAQMIPRSFDGFPNVKAWLDRCQARPAFTAMMAKREAEPNMA